MIDSMGLRDREGHFAPFKETVNNLKKTLIMKKLLIYFVIAVCLCGTFISCTKTTVSIEINGTDADYVVTNKTTGESLVNQGIYINIGPGEGEVLEVKNGDELELVYKPESKYEQYSWSVDFKLFNEEIVTVSKSPYKYTFIVGDIPQGIYYITCKASINDKGVQAKGFVSGSVRVKVVE
ncbi:MAG: hypothetical protein II299_06110 [Alistipes sp.]|nr:hypothetical protein [Alistipes sp.]